MKIDSIRVYQSRDPSAHVGANHTIGCDPPEFPTREFIRGHEYRYMRNAPFSYDDKGPLKKHIQKGGGKCHTDDDCGGNLKRVNLTEVFESSGAQPERKLAESEVKGQGKCVDSSQFEGMFAMKDKAPRVCQCNKGFIGPHCLAEEHIDDTPSAFDTRMQKSPFTSIAEFRVTPFMVFLVVALLLQMIVVGCIVTKRRKSLQNSIDKLKPVVYSSAHDRVVTGTSI